MSVDQVSLLLALLSFMALGLALIVGLLLVTGGAERLAPVFDIVLPLAFFIALVCTSGSLYYSGIVHFRPCRLCWWQRIFMYPLVPLLGIAMLRRDRMIGIYALPLAAMGLAWSIYHTWLRWFPGEGSCEVDAACTSVWVNEFGFVSIPFMAGAGFLAIIALLAASLKLDRSAPAS